MFLSYGQSIPAHWGKSEAVVQKMHRVYNNKQMTPSVTVSDLLATLGFDADACKLYESLWNNGAQSMSELARTSGVERTKAYRLLPQLKEAHLVAVDTEYSSDIVHISSPDNLQDLLDKKQRALQTAQRELPALIARQADVQLHKSRVNVYRGSNGLKQLLWNETMASTEVLSVLQEPIQVKTNSAYFERWVERCNQKGLVMRSVVGDKFSASRDKWYDSHVNESLSQWKGRSINEEIFSIDQNMVIYDDVVAYFTWNAKDIFGVEIHNPAIAHSQRQFFELLWRAAS